MFCRKSPRRAHLIRWACTVLSVAFVLLLARSLWWLDATQAYVPGVGSVTVCSGGGGVTIFCTPPEWNVGRRWVLLNSKPWHLAYGARSWELLLPSRSGMSSVDTGHAWMGESKYSHCPQLLLNFGCEMFWVYHPAGHEDFAILDPNSPDSKIGPRDWTGGYDGCARCPQTFLVLPLATLTVFLWFKRWKQRAYAARVSLGLCPTCSYDLRAHLAGNSPAGNKCPECGSPILRPS